ncbi:recQ [Mytilus edulis]|uniref:RecQ n=1 Tax=Mytilus edulis TaxID=6550 RepID=A0A8S3TC98_MYTED|nr:recQ [Mytilus edulis]
MSETSVRKYLANFLYDDDTCALYHRSTKIGDNHRRVLSKEEMIAEINVNHKIDHHKQQVNKLLSLKTILHLNDLCHTLSDPMRKFGRQAFGILCKVRCPIHHLPRTVEICLAESLRNLAMMAEYENHLLRLGLSPNIKLKTKQVEVLKLLEAKNLEILAILPTGYGKSLIYQLAPLILDGTVVVFSPLSVIQEEQIQKLRTSGLKCCILNTRMPSYQYVVVEFLDEGSVEVVHQTWLESEEKVMFCYWPRKNSTQCAKKGQIPDKEFWRRYRIRIFSYTAIGHTEGIGFLLEVRLVTTIR